MDTGDQKENIRPDDPIGRLLRRAGTFRVLIAVAGLVFAGLVVWADLGVLPAIVAFAALAGAAFASRRIARPDAVPTDRSDAAQPRQVEAYAAFAARLPDPCFVIDRQGRVQHANRPATALLGPIGAGQPISFLLRAPELGEAIQRTLETGAPTPVTYFERVPADRWVQALVAPLGPEDAAAAPFALILLRDVSEAQRVERMRADFVANASHELRTPLASLSGFIETLQGPARDDPAARERFLQIMGEQARRMARLIDDLMSLSRVELKAHLRPESTVDLAPILGHVVEAMAPLAQDGGVEIRADLPGHPLLVIGDHDELAQVFQNLVHNAIKYGQSGGRVDVTARLRPGTPALVIASVRDYGPGIEPEHVPRLTERFYRVDPGASRERGGTGLGLAIVKHILARHRGQLRIDSTPGAGAVFNVQLESAEPGPDPAERTTEPSGLRNEEIFSRPTGMQAPRQARPGFPASSSRNSGNGRP